MPISKTWAGATYNLPLNREPKGSWGIEVSNFLIAIANNAIAVTGGTQILTAELNLGTAFGLVAPYIKSASANIAATGVVELAKADLISWRNNANTADLSLGIDGSDNLTFNGINVSAGPANLAAHIASTTVHGVTGVVVGTTDTQTLTNKTLTTPVQTGYEDFTDITTPALPAAGKTRLYSKNGQLYRSTSTASELSLGGASGGGKNYLSASSSSAAGWLVTAGAAVATNALQTPEPSVGSGVGLTFTSNGAYCYVRWTMDPNDYGVKQLLKFAANTGLNSYIGGQAVLQLYSNTASDYSGTSTRLVLSTDVAGVSAISTAPNYSGNFDAPGASARYMELRFVSTITGLVTLVLSSLTTGPGSSVQGAVIGPWKSFTPVFSGGGTTTVNGGMYRQEGDSLRIRTSTHFSGAGSGGFLALAMPTGYTINTSALPFTVNNQVTVVGFCELSISGSNTTAYSVFASTANQVGIGYTGGAFPGSSIVSGSEVAFDFTMPVNELTATVNLGQNDLQFFYPTGGTWGTSNAGLGTAQGPGGLLGGTTTPSASQFQFAFYPPTPIPVGAKPVIEVSADQVHWSPLGGLAGSNLIMIENGRNDGTNYIGIGITNLSTGQINVIFGKYPSGTSNTWASVGTWYFRVSVGLPGQAVGFGAYNPGVSSGLVPTAGLPGNAVAPTTGTVGEKLLATSTTLQLTTTATNVLTLTLTPGVWEAEGMVQVSSSPASRAFVDVTLSSSSGASGNNGSSRIIGALVTNGANSYGFAYVSKQTFTVASGATLPIYLVASAQANSTAATDGASLIAIRK